MSMDNNVTVHQLHLVGLDDLQKRSGMILVLGVILILLGTVALGLSVLFTLASMVFIGWLMIMAGVLQTAHGFSVKAWGGFFIELLAGLLYSVVGFLIIIHPAAAAVELTLIIALLLIFGGMFRVAIAIAVRLPNTIWLLIHGAINILLGMAIIAQWPASGLWVIGMFIGIDMIFNGWTLVMLAMAAKRLGKPA